MPVDTALIRKSDGDWVHYKDPLAEESYNVYENDQYISVSFTVMTMIFICKLLLIRESHACYFTSLLVVR